MINNLSVFKKLKNQNAFDPKLLEYFGSSEQIESFKESLKQNFPQIKSQTIDDFVQFLNLF